MDDVSPSARQQITCAQEDRGSLISAAPSVRMTTGDTGPRPPALPYDHPGHGNASHQVTGADTSTRTVNAPLIEPAL